MYDIEELHKVLLEIANEIHRICVKNNIEYSINGGTLLGAIRHKGFIPWDDDFDLGMTRANYNLFIEAIKTDLSDQYSYISMHNDNLYSLPFMKILKKNTLLRESTLPENMPGHGIFVDIFPYDNVPESKFRKTYHEFITDTYFRLLLAKSKYKLELEKYSAKNLVYTVFKGIAYIIPRSFLIKRLEENSTRYNKENSKDLTTIGGAYGYKNEIIRKELFESLELLEFADTQYYGFKNYEENLRYLYGDYMEYPPEDERYNRHSYEFVDFDLSKK